MNYNNASHLITRRAFPVLLLSYLLICFSCSDKAPEIDPRTVIKYKTTDNNIVAINQEELVSHAYNEEEDCFIAVFKEPVSSIPTQLANDKLKHITMPPHLNSIRERQFFECTALESIVLPDSLYYIWEEAFRGCSSLSKIELPDMIREIDKLAFMDCTGLTELIIPSSMESISKNAFYKCSNIKRVVSFSDRVYVDVQYNNLGIRDTDLYMLSKIAFINAVDATIEGDFVFAKTDTRSWGLNGSEYKNPPTALKTMALYMGNAEDVVLPANFNGENYIIGPMAFAGNKTIKSITIPKGVRYIGKRVFDDCSSLESVVFAENMEEISNNAFRSCTSLKSIVMPDSVNALHGNIFNQCSSLESVVLPVNTEALPEGLFKGCTSLKSIELPDGITDIGPNSFKDCSSIDNLVIPNGVKIISYSTFENCTSLKSVVLPDSVNTIYHHAFSNCTSLENFNMPDCLKEIWSDAFSKCSSLKRVVFPDSLEKIKYNAFRDCSSLTELVIPKTVNEIENNAFAGCSALQRITVDENNMAYNSKDECNAIIHTATGTLLRGCSNTIIPDNVMIIGDNAFNRDTTLKSIVLPETVYEIGENAFSDCTSLKSVEIKGIVYKIGERAFCNCTSLTGFKIPIHLKSIEASTFENCTSLVSVKIPLTTEEIGENAFRGCTKLENVQFSNKLGSISDGAFMNCGKLSDIKFPSMINHIGDSAFYGCNNVEVPQIDKKANAPWYVGTWCAQTPYGTFYYTIYPNGEIAGSEPGNHHTLRGRYTVSGKTLSARFSGEPGGTYFTLHKSHDLIGIGSGYYLERVKPIEADYEKPTREVYNEISKIVNDICDKLNNNREPDQYLTKEFREKINEAYKIQYEKDMHGAFLEVNYWTESQDYDKLSVEISRCEKKSEKRVNVKATFMDHRSAGAIIEISERCTKVFDFVLIDGRWLIEDMSIGDTSLKGIAEEFIDFYR